MQIDKDRELPVVVRTPAAELRRILIRERTAAQRFATQKTVRTVGTWVCLPVDYVRFCLTPMVGDGISRQARSLKQPEDWLAALHRAVLCTGAGPAKKVFPVLPCFQSKPFAAMIAPRDPTDMERVLGNRYFVASTELNLLNMLLFGGEEGAD